MSRSATPLSSFLAGLSVGDALPVRVMAILNVSPESFYQGSVQTRRERFAEAAQAMVNAGADIIDIGAMSTAPYLKTHISVAEETARLAQAVEVVAAAVTIPISADTQRAQPAAAALAAGARIINDVSGLKQDPAMAALIAEAGAGAILMASEVTPGTGAPTARIGAPTARTGAPMARIQEALVESLQIAAQAGIPREHIVLDPGIGFFRKLGMPWDDWDCTVLRELSSLRVLGAPLLIGVSRKSFIGKILGQPQAAERLLGSLACAAVTVCNGAHLIRTHDVRETIETVRMAERLRPER